MLKDIPLVSVIVPYYNGRKFIREAVQSILNQTYPNIEIIVVDDASPEPEDAVYIKRLSDELAFKLIVHPTNKGPGQTMADAVEASHGEYIAELSQDDLFKPKKIERQMIELKERRLDAVYAVGDILEESSGRIRKRNTAETSKIIRSGEAIKYLKTQNLACISIQGLLAKRSVFEKDIIPIWREFLLDDWPVNIRLFEKYNVGFIEEPLWTGRTHKANTSRNIWKWLGPQIEVVARLAPIDAKAEGIGNRIGSMARRLLKQKGDMQDIIRLGLAALMLTETPEQYKKVLGVLDKIPLREKRTIIELKIQRIKEAVNTSGVSTLMPQSGEKATWDNLGKQITTIAASCPQANRVDEIGKVFIRLANECLLEETWSSAENAVKTALAGIILVKSSEAETAGLKLLGLCVSNGLQQVVNKKLNLLKSQSRFNIKSILSFINLFLLPVFLVNLLSGHSVC